MELPHVPMPLARSAPLVHCLTRPPLHMVCTCAVLQVRSLNYMRTKIKEPSGDCIYRCAAWPHAPVLWAGGAALRCCRRSDVLQAARLRERCAPFPASGPAGCWVWMCMLLISSCTTLRSTCRCGLASGKQRGLHGGRQRQQPGCEHGFLLRLVHRQPAAPLSSTPVNRHSPPRSCRRRRCLGQRRRRCRRTSSCRRC